MANKEIISAATSFLFVEESNDIEDVVIEEENDCIPKERFIGLADIKGINPWEVDADELLKGIEVEMEHTDDPAIALDIAMDHLAEIPDYYTRLAKMESDAGVSQ